jgi:putative endonuclease
MASKAHGTLYVGVTSDLENRVAEHRDLERPGFTRRYAVHRLVLFEEFGTMDDAIAREKQLKRWRRQWKLNVIEDINPGWRDLAEDLGFPPLAR